jgi:AcrR family transcriptional regulator
MSTPAAKSRTLSTAEDRRAAVLVAATKVFAARGFDATPTLEVAKAAGISQAYLFRLFPTKDDLAIALVNRCNERIEAAFAAAAARAKATGEDVLEAMGDAYVELIADRDVLVLQLHAHAAAASKPAIRDAMRASFKRLFALVQRESGVEDARVGAFFRYGMMLNVLGALDAYDLDADWVRLATLSESDDTPC